MSKNVIIPTTHLKREEAEAIAKLQNILSLSATQLKLVGKNGDAVAIPEPIYEALCQVVHAVLSGQIITLIPDDRELTPEEAADLLNVSRPYLIKLLDRGEIPHQKDGTHRRIPYQDLITYQQQRDEKRREGLMKMTQFLQDEGFYDAEVLDSH